MARDGFEMLRARASTPEERRAVEEAARDAEWVAYQLEHGDGEAAMEVTPDGRD